MVYALPYAEVRQKGQGCLTRSLLLAACDVYRPAAVRQLEINGEKVGVEVFSMGDKVSPVEIAKEAYRKASGDRYNVLIPAMKIRKKGTYIKEVNTLLDNRCKGYEGCDGVFIDVFVYDYMTPDKCRDLPRRLFNQLLMVPAVLADNVLKINPKKIKKMIMDNTHAYGDKHREEKSDYVGFDLTWVWKNPFHPFIFRYDDIFPVQYVDFEDTKLPIAHHPHEFLSMAIAPTYMELPPENKRFAKHTVDIRLKEE